MVLMGSHGCLSILVMGTVDIIGRDRSLSILEVGPHGQSSMVVMGPCCRLSIVVVGGHGRSLILVGGTCQWG